MKKSIAIYLLVTFGIFSSAWGIAESGLYSWGEALARALAFFVVFNLFLIFRAGFRALKRIIYNREMKNPKYQDTDSDE